MLRILIKNYLKLVFRDYTSWTICILGPIFLILMTAVCLDQSFLKQIQINEVLVGSNETTLGIEAEKIKLSDMDKEEGIKQIAKGQIAGYIEEDTDGFTLYLPEQLTDESIYLKHQVRLFLQGQQVKERLIKGENLITHTTIEAKRPPSSMDYYGRVEFIGCVWISAFFAAKIALAERKDNIQVRIQQAGLPIYSIWLARAIAIFIAYSIANGIILIWLNVKFQMYWGENVGITIGLVLLVMVTFTCVNTFLSFVFRREATFILSVWFIWMSQGFLGGDFQDYYHNFLPERIQRHSITYFFNHSIMEIADYGQSRYLWPCILRLIILMIGSILLSFWWIRRERRQDV